MFNVLKICENLGVLKTLYFIKILLRILLILVPVLVIIRVMYTLLKSMFTDSQSSKQVKKSLIIVLIGVVIFFVPNIVSIFISYVASPENMFSCFDNANPETIKFLTEIENKKFAEEIEKLQQRNKEINVVFPSLNNSGSSGLQNSSYKNLNHIYVGDSKTVGMYTAVVGKSTKGTSIATHKNNYWYAKGSQGYSWFESTAYPATEKKLKTANYVFYHLMGTNDLKSQNRAEKYVNLLEKLAKKYPNSKFVVVSVTPIHDSKAKKKGYKVVDKEVVSFNKKYVNAVREKGLTNLTYCDVYSSVIDNFETGDGIHYTKTTYKRIYALLENC